MNRGKLRISENILETKTDRKKETITSSKQKFNNNRIEQKEQEEVYERHDSQLNITKYEKEKIVLENKENKENQDNKENKDNKDKGQKKDEKPGSDEKDKDQKKKGGKPEGQDKEKNNKLSKI
jgi:hypothetical protein